MKKENILELLKRPIAFHPIFAKVTQSVNAGLFLSQLLYWTDKGRIEGGWIYKTAAEWREETCLTQDEQRTARKKLKSLDLLQEHRNGLDPTLHFRINFMKLSELISSYWENPTQENEVNASGDNNDPNSEEGNPQQTPSGNHASQGSQPPSESSSEITSENSLSRSLQEITIDPKNKRDQQAMMQIQTFTPDDISVAVQIAKQKDDMERAFPSAVLRALKNMASSRNSKKSNQPGYIQTSEDQSSHASGSENFRVNQMREALKPILAALATMIEVVRYTTKTRREAENWLDQWAQFCVTADLNEEDLTRGLEYIATKWKPGNRWGFAEFREICISNRPYQIVAQSLPPDVTLETIKPEDRAAREETLNILKQNKYSTS
jgi:hypothetical protein